MKSTTWFDKFADRAEEIVARAIFFAFCVIIVIIWIPTLFLLEINTSQLIINTLTTIITFLLVALLQNTQKRFEDSMCGKMDAQSKALAEFIEHASLWFPNTDDRSNTLNKDTHNTTFEYAKRIADELRESIGS